MVWGSRPLQDGPAPREGLPGRFRESGGLQAGRGIPLELPLGLLDIGWGGSHRRVPGSQRRVAGGLLSGAGRRLGPTRVGPGKGGERGHVFAL